MRAAEMVERIVTSLRAVLRRAGKGAMHRASRRAGYRPEYFSGWVWPGEKRGAWHGLGIGTLAHALEVARLEPGAFFALSFPRPDPVALFVDEARRLAPRLPEPLTLQHARRRFIDESLRIHDDQDVAAVGELERLRQRDPDRARRRAAALVGRTLCAEAAAGALGVWASCIRRNIAKLDHATVLLGTALEISERYGLSLVSARLALRAASIVGDRAEYERGLALAEWAAVVYSEALDRVGQGLAHFSRAKMMVYSGREAQAARAFEAATRQFSEDSNVYLRIAAWQGLGFACYELNELEKAQTALRKARNLLPKEASAETHGQLRWVEAQVAAAQGNLDQADRLYMMALAFTTQSQLWVDAAMIAAERARVLIRLGQSREARSFAESLTGLVIPLQDTSPLATAALTDLIRAAMEGEQLDLALVETIIEKIERGRLHSAPAPS